MKINTTEHEEKMKKAIAAFESNLSTIRAGQANPAVLNRVSFEYYGAPTPINTMADIKVTDSKTIAIMPYDASTLKAMEKAILASDVGITPTNDGKIIRLVLPGGFTSDLMVKAVPALIFAGAVRCMASGRQGIAARSVPFPAWSVMEKLLPYPRYFFLRTS